VDASDSSRGPPDLRVKRHWSVKVAMEEQQKFIQSRSKVQKVFGVEIS